MLIIITIFLDLITAGSYLCNLKNNYTENRILFREITINHYFISIPRKGPKIALQRNPRTTSDTREHRMRRIVEHFLFINIAGFDRMCISKINIHGDLTTELPDFAIFVGAEISKVYRHNRTLKPYYLEHNNKPSHFHYQRIVISKEN
jgi:hypothetical protein